MALRYQVSCINKHDHGDPHERIKKIGGISGGQRWTLLEDEAISGIVSGKWEFFVSAGGRDVDVIIAAHGSRKYLKTVADGYAPNNLLNLPECP